LMKDFDAVRQATDFNQSLQHDPTQPDRRSKSDGAACDSNDACKSGLCAESTGRSPSTGPIPKVCVLEDLAADATSALDSYRNSLLADQFWRPFYASAALSLASLLPAEWDSKRVISPAAIGTLSAASMVFSLRAWTEWAFTEIALSDMYQHGDDLKRSLHAVFMSLVDCSDFTDHEMHAATQLGDYYCYVGPPVPPPPPPPPPGSASFSVSGGPCRTTDGGTCATSPNYPSEYGNNERCTLSVTFSVPSISTASLSAIDFNTESGYDKLTIGNTDFEGTAGPQGVRVTSSSTISWRTDSSNTDPGWKICLSACDTACQRGSPSPPSSGAQPGFSTGMASTLAGIKTKSRENPVLSSWNTHCKVFIAGLFFALLQAFTNIALMLPTTWRNVKVAADLVLCAGRCCGTIHSSDDLDGSQQPASPVIALRPGSVEPASIYSATQAVNPDGVSNAGLSSLPPNTF
jgi:hypothetical protein